MPPEIGTPQDWLRIAQADLEIAQIQLPPKGLYEQLCFHAQQAAEKSIKAVLVFNKIDFPNTHNLQLLIDLLPSETPRTLALLTAARLTVYAVSFRYPGEYEPIQKEEYVQALKLADEIFTWASDIVSFAK